MTCIKTGCHIYIEPYGEWAYGDAFSYENEAKRMIHWFRICQRSREPLSNVIHFFIKDFHDWFDKEKSDQKQNSTMVASAVVSFGYNGIPIPGELQ